MAKVHTLFSLIRYHFLAEQKKKRRRPSYKHIHSVHTVWFVLFCRLATKNMDFSYYFTAFDKIKLRGKMLQQTALLTAYHLEIENKYACSTQVKLYE